MCETVATLVAYGASTYVLNGNDGNTGFGGLWGAEGVRVGGGGGVKRYNLCNCL